jgi:hypothetical protein
MNIVVVEYFSQTKHTTGSAPFQHVTVGQCCFVANSVDLTVDQSIVRSLPDCRKWSVYGGFVPVMPYEYDLDERESWCNYNAVNCVWIESWLLSAILK